MRILKRGGEDQMKVTLKYGFGAGIGGDGGKTLTCEREQWKQESSKWLVRQPVARKRQQWCS